MENVDRVPIKSSESELTQVTRIATGSSSLETERQSRSKGWVTMSPDVPNTSTTTVVDVVPVSAKALPTANPVEAANDDTKS
ncbi:unnamed protein product [Hymenolepis diminuta]|uniref:Uncharacterized protein n=1 Tax=Hymenolepis diminuta TaxID=6216 RepID=A0A564XX33_HYMDI|nr:unnamed protein product [Hymenolepis diminuta]